MISWKDPPTQPEKITPALALPPVSNIAPGKQVLTATSGKPLSQVGLMTSKKPMTFKERMDLSKAQGTPASSLYTE